MSEQQQSNNAAKEEKRIRMTTQPVEKLICRLAIPTIISMLVTSFYNLADTFFVRHLEQDSMVAAVGVVLPLMNIIQAIGSTTATAPATLSPAPSAARTLTRRTKWPPPASSPPWGWGWC